MELGTILLWFFIADRTQVIAAGEKASVLELAALSTGNLKMWSLKVFNKQSLSSTRCPFLSMPSSKDIDCGLLSNHLNWLLMIAHSILTSFELQSYSRDLFIFLFVVLTIVAAGYSLRASRSPVLLHRHQTEEWKGWMQVGK